MKRLLPLLLLLAGCPKDKGPEAITDPAAIDLDVLDRWVAEMLPIVEEAAGRSYDHRPPARMGTRLELERILEAEAKLILKRIYRDAPDFVVDRMAAESRGSAPGVVGKYGIETKAMYLSPDAVAGIVAAYELGPEQVEPAAKLVLAHELVHALQDQQGDLLPSFGGQRDNEALEAFNAVLEGHANFVEERVSQKMGWELVRHKMDAAQGWSDEGGLESPSGFPTWFRYGMGKAFVKHHHLQGGDDAAWNVVLNPPATTTMIFRPDTYAPRLQEDTDYDDELEGIEEFLTEGAWTRVNSVIGERDLRAEGLSFDQDRLDEILSHMTYGYGTSAVRTDRSAEIRILHFDDAKWPAEYVDLVVDHAESIAEQGTGGFGAGITAKPWERLEGVQAMQHIVTMGSASSEVQSVWVMLGDRLVIVQTTGFRPGLRMVAAVDALLTRLEE